MPDFPVIRNVDPIVISPAAPQSIGEALSGLGLATTSPTWVSANRAIYVPFSVAAPLIIVKMFVINGSAVSGNIDVGIYDRGGVRLVSAGSTAQVGTAVVQEFDITDTTLNPGLYYLAGALDNTTGTITAWSPAAAVCRSLGVFQQATAFPLPSTATFVAPSGARIPFVGATQRTVV